MNPARVVEYRIARGAEATIIDARPAELAAVDTSVQEMTGDWRTYP